MILIADSGSTKTDWCLIDHGREVKRIRTKGINPFFQTEDEIAVEVKKCLFPELDKAEIEQIWFYGAGCIPEKYVIIQQAIGRVLFSSVQVGSDLLGAARALCQQEAGIACILGTGSNSCFYNGTEIAGNVSPLGFILGDEGSGAVLGRLFVGDCLKNQLPTEIKELFLDTYLLTPAMILEKVYRQPFPNRFLAGLTPFLSAHLEVPQIHALVLNSFKAFFTRNVKQYDFSTYPVHFAGSVAWYFQPVLKQAAEAAGIRLATIVQTPLPGLITYHSHLSNK